MTSCRFLGVSPDKFHELNLPFYSRSPLGNGKVTEADVAPIKNLLQELKPHQIFFADDYACGCTADNVDNGKLTTLR